MDAASLPAAYGPFRLTAILGEGGSGIVYDATWGPRRVALKVLHPSLAADKVRAQFFAEAERLKAIAHPSVVKVLAVGEGDDGRPYLAMERLDGETLAQRLAGGAIALPAALDLFAELCAAVDALHAQGLIHRDLKPENVFVVGGAHAVLLDFGIAKEAAAPASTTTQDGGVRGTPAYMAPERFFGTPASAATDIYELAVILYAMLAGRLPWDDLGDPEARLSPRSLEGIPPELDVEIRRALSTRAQNRPASAGEFLAAVRAAAGGDDARGPSETARMRPSAEQARATSTGKPWFADRQPTTDRGKTPLAWAPTAAAPAPVKRKRWPWIAGAIAIAALGGGAYAWKRSQKPVVAADQLPPEKDPWGVRAVSQSSEREAREAHEEAPLKPPTDELVAGPPLAPAKARAEIDAAVARLPPDDQIIGAMLVGDMRRDERIANAIRSALRRPDLAIVLGAIPPCMQQIAATADWIVVGAVSVEKQEGTIVARGAWAREQIVACFTGAVPTELGGGATVYKLADLGWIDFVDERTVYLSVRPDLSAAQVHARAVGKVSPGATAHARQLYATAPKDPVLVLVADGGKDRWPSDSLPKTSDAVAWMRQTPEGVGAEVRIDTHDEDAAATLAANWRQRFNDLFGTLSAATVGSALVMRDRTVVHVQARLTTLALKMLAK